MERRTLAAAVDGDALCVAVVGASARGAWSRRGARIERFLSLTDAERSAELAPAAHAAGARARIALVAPAAWCVSREVEMDSAGWDAARAEVERSIDRLLPLEPGDALVGLIDLQAEGEERGAGARTTGALVGVRRSLIEPWMDALVRAVPGARIEAVLAPEMAALGAGIGRGARVVVEDEEGEARLTLVDGVATGVGESAEARGVEGAERVRLGAAISGHDLAVGGALAARAARGAYAPLVGSRPAARRRWVWPAVAAAVAVIAAVAAMEVRGARYERAASAAAERFEEVRERVAAVHALRAEAERWARVVGEGIGPVEAGWGSVLPALAAAQGATPEDGFAHRIEIDGARVVLRAEAGSAGEALRRLEESEQFAGAEFTAPVSRGAGEGAGATEVFEVRAKREASAGGRP